MILPEVHGPAWPSSAVASAHETVCSVLELVSGRELLLAAWGMADGVAARVREGEVGVADCRACGVVERGETQDGCPGGPAPERRDQGTSRYTASVSGKT